MRSRSISGIAAVTLLTSAIAAHADSIAPSSYSTTLGVGESVTINKTVTIEAGPPTTTRTDIFFLADNTGSMGGLISTVQANAASILAQTSSFGDVAWGVGRYEDFPTSPWGNAGNVPWELLTDITTNTAAVTAGIGAWRAFGGNDIPESNFEGLQEMADTVSWRAGSARFAIWFGDAPSHDPADTPGYPGPTQAETIAALNAQGIHTIAVDVGALDLEGEATAITSATGGSIETDISNIVQTIQDSISSAFDTYNTVSLALNGLPAGVTVDFAPPSISGAFDRSIERVFNFAVTFTGTAPGSYSFSIDALVDGAVVATELDDIDVPGVPLPATMPLIAAGIAALGLAARRRRPA